MIKSKYKPDSSTRHERNQHLNSIMIFAFNEGNDYFYTSKSKKRYKIRNEDN